MTTAPLIRREEVSSRRLVGTLTLTALLSGVAIAGIYELTLPTIEANRARALKASVFEVVPGATRMEARVFADGGWLGGADGGGAPGPGAPTEGTDADVADPGGEPATEGGASGDGEIVYATFDDTGRLLGFAIQGDGPGYQDTIEIIFGYDPASERVVGMRVLESRETPGLGDKIYKDLDFVAQFESLAASGEIVVTKDGASAPNEIDAITGATISSRAVAGIIQRSLETWGPRLAAEGAP